MLAPSKKSRGIYYTPQYVVDYLVAQTLGPLLRNKTPDDVRRLKIIDPACGAGAFLLGAYQHLLAWHQRWYENHAQHHRSNHKPHSPEGQSQLTRRERIRIGASCLFGVDLDAEAVEKCKHTLRSAILDGADTSRDSEQDLLDKNIRCGDALVGADFVDSQRTSQGAVHPFDWHGAFEAVLSSGGFDAVLGNPPFVNIRVLSRELSPAIKAYFRSHYTCARGNYDLYVLFVELAGRLLRQGGRCGLVLPNKIATLNYSQTCRSLLLENSTIERITDAADLRVFQGASVYPHLMVWRNTPPAPGHKVEFLQAEQHVDRRLLRTRVVNRWPQARLNAARGFALHGELDIESRVPTRPLSDCCTLHSGTSGFSAQRMSGVLRERRDVGRRKHWEFIVSGNIDRYAVTLGGVRFMQRSYKQPVLPLDACCLTDRKRELYSAPKIVIAGLTRRLEAAWDERGLALGVQVYAAADLHEDSRYLLALLNSRLLSHLFRLRFPAKRLSGGFLAVNKGQLVELPIRIIVETDTASHQMCAKITKLVDRLSKLQVRLTAAGNDTERSSLQQRIAAADQQIDQLVYQLYDLTAAEITDIERHDYQSSSAR